jgi:hypothetical protein
MIAPTDHGPTILAVDPGSTQSGWVLLVAGQPVAHGLDHNHLVLDSLLTGAFPDDAVLAVEMVASYGMPVGAEVFETCVWIGRFVQAWTQRPFRYVYRKDVKLHLTGQPRAKDANIRQALIDRWGGKEAAVGCKAKPGPLYGIRADTWQALAVAVTAREVGK